MSGTDAATRAPRKKGRRKTAGRYATRAELELAVVRRDRTTASRMNHIAVATGVSEATVASIIREWNGRKLPETPPGTDT